MNQDHQFISLIMGFVQTALSVYGAATVGFAVFLMGESAILAVAALSAQGFIGIKTALVWSFIGSLSADIFWYSMITKFFKKQSKEHLQETKPSEDQALLLHFAQHHTFVVLFFIKFLVGMRLFLTFYIVLKKHIKFGTYLWINSLGTLLFVGILFPLGWLLGKGVSSVLSFERGFMGIISVLVLVLVLLPLLRRAIVWIVALADKREH